MTQDTAKALEIIIPLADELGIRVEADDEKLYVNDTQIAISLNSTWATVFEFIGYLITEYNTEFRPINLTDKQLETIRRSWYPEKRTKTDTGLQKVDYGQSMYGGWYFNYRDEYGTIRGEHADTLAELQKRAEDLRCSLAYREDNC